MQNQYRPLGWGFKTRAQTTVLSLLTHVLVIPKVWKTTRVAVSPILSGQVHESNTPTNFV